MCLPHHSDGAPNTHVSVHPRVGFPQLGNEVTGDPLQGGFCIQHKDAIHGDNGR